MLNALLEERLVKGKGWVEFSVYPLYSPQSLIAEGSANYGIDLAFPALFCHGSDRRGLRLPAAALGPLTPDVARNPLPRLDRASLLAATLVAASLNRLFVKMSDSVALERLGARVRVPARRQRRDLDRAGGAGRPRRRRHGTKPARTDWWLCGAALACCLLPTGWEAGLGLARPVGRSASSASRPGAASDGWR